MIRYQTIDVDGPQIFYRETVLWGRYDPSFTEAGAHAYADDVPRGRDPSPGRWTPARNDASLGSALGVVPAPHTPVLAGAWTAAHRTRDARLTARTGQSSSHCCATIDSSHPFCLAYGLPPIAPMDTSRPHERRQYPRTRVSWPVLIHDGATRYLARSLDLSPSGAKVRTKTRLRVGTAVQVEVVPPDGPPLRVAATVWRIDSNGLAFLFRNIIRHHLIRETHQPAVHPREVAETA